MLSFLEKLASMFWDVIRRIVGLVLPFFSHAREYRAIGPGLKKFLHVFLLACILAGLYWVNWYFDLSRYLPKAPTQFLRNSWLPIIFLLLYALLWLGWWLWKLLGPEEESSDFPDIDEAWEEASSA